MDAGNGGSEESLSTGTRFDLARGADFIGGDVRSIADAGRTGGPAVTGEKVAPERPGDAVWDLDGGGAGSTGLGGSSAPAFIGLDREDINFD